MASTRKDHTYSDRQAKGRRAISIWIEAPDGALLDVLADRWGLAGPRDVIVTALRMCAKMGGKRG